MASFTGSLNAGSSTINNMWDNGGVGQTYNSPDAAQTAFKNLVAGNVATNPASSTSPSTSVSSGGGGRTTTNPYAVVTSAPATANYNSIQADYNNNIKPAVTNAATTTNTNTAVANSLPVIAGYNVSPTPTGNAGEVKAKNNATGQEYYITPQKPTATSGDIANILSNGSNSPTPTSNPVGTNPPSTNPPTPAQTAEGNTGLNANAIGAQYNSQVTGIASDLDSAYNTFQSTVASIMSGAFPLSPAQQSLVDATNSAFKQMTEQSNLKAAALSSQTGGVSNKVNATAGELTNITAQQAATVAKLEMGFQDQNYKMVTESYAAFKDLENSKMDAIEKLHNSVMDTYNKALDAAQKVQDNINAVAMDAAKNGADTKTLAAIRASRDEAGAISAAGNYLQYATGTMGDYLQYKRDAEAKGLVPTDYQNYKDAQDAKDSQRKINEAVAIHNAEQKSDAAFTASDKNQQKLEQQYRQTLSKQFSSRTGSLGIENGKVNQANHLNTLFKQYYDPKTGNYNIPTSAYNEAILGLANLIAPTGVASDSLRDSINQATAKGDFNKALGYVTGTPITGNTQAVIKTLIDSVDRQAETAVRNREAALQNMRDMAPTDLDPSRVEKLNKSTNMVHYEGQGRISKANINTYVQSHPENAENIAKMYDVPGATDESIEADLKARGILQ